MARDPQFEQQLNDARKLLKQLNDIRMQLGRSPIKLVDEEAIRALRTLPADIRDAQNALAQMDGSATNLYERLKAVTSEFRNQTSEQANIRKGFRGLTSVVEQLKFEEAGINDLNTKQLASLSKRAKIEKERITSSSRALINNTKDYGVSLRGLDEEVQKRIQSGAKQDEINELVSQSLKFHHNLNDEQKAMLQSYYDQENTVDAIVEKTEKRLDLERAIDKKVSGFSAINDVVGAIPGLRMFSKPFEAAEKAARETAKFNAKTGNTLSTGAAGRDAMFKSMSKSMLGVAGIATALVKVVQFIVDLFISADKNMINIAKNTGVTRTQAEMIRKEFIRIAASSDNILVNSESLLKAQYEFIQALGVTTVGSRQLAESQVFLTENLGISGEKAAELQLLLSASGTDVAGLTDRTIGFANAQAAANGFLISGQEIIREMATTSAEIQSYYGFQADELARAVFQTRKLGLNLTAANSISESLLNFESSIAGELELELLTSRQMNFERARALAATGDIAGATQEVMEQMMSLTDEQMKSPIILQAAAAASGLSVEQISRARLIQKNLNKEQREYIAQLRQAGNLEAAKLAEQLGIQGQSRDEIMKTLTAQDKFNAALTKAKDQFTGLVDSGALQGFVDVLISLTNSLAGLLGLSSKMTQNRIEASSDRVETAVELNKEIKNSPLYEEYTLAEAKAREANAKAMAIENMDMSPLTIGSVFGPAFGISSYIAKKAASMYYGDKADTAADIADMKAFELEGAASVDDFILRPGMKPIKYNKDDIIVGGTSLDSPVKRDYEIEIDSFKPVLNTTVNTDNKVSEKTNALLEKLISAVKSGGDVYIDGNKAGRAMVLGQHKLS